MAIKCNLPLGNDRVCQKLDVYNPKTLSKAINSLELDFGGWE
jgi:hypothetical protein